MNPLESALHRPKQGDQSRDVILAAALLAAAFGLRLAFDPVLGDKYPYLLLLVPTAFAAWRCSWKTAALVAIAGFLLADWFFIQPRFSLALHGSAAQLLTVAYAVVSAAVITFGAILQRQARRLQRELSERRQVEDELRRVAQFPEQNPSAVMRVAHDGTLLYANPASGALLKSWKCRVGEMVPERLRTWLAETTQSERINEFDETVEDRTLRFTAAPFPHLGYVNLYSIDVTEMKRVELAKARTLERFHLLSDVSGRLLAAEDPKPIIESLCGEVMEHLGCDVFFNYLIDDAQRQLRLNAFAGITEEQAREIEWLEAGILNRERPGPEQQRIALESLCEKEAPPEWMRALGIRSCVGYPLIAGGTALGTLWFGRRHEKTFAPDDQELTQRIAGQVAIAVDRIRSAEALRRSEQHFRALANGIPNLVWMARGDGWIFWYNDRWYEYTGTTPGQMEGWGWQSVQDPAHLYSVTERWNASILSGEPFEMVFPLRGADGQFRQFLTRVIPIRDAREQVVLWFGTNTDITAEVRAKEALQESEERFRIMADASPAMIWISDRAKACTWVNRAWLDYVGMPLEKQAGSGWVENLHPEDRAACLDIYSTAFDRREAFKMEYRLRRHDGSYRWLQACGTPMYGATGEFKGYIGSCVDMHERRLQQEDLERAVRERTAQLQESVGELESFSYSIAHDMRAPLRAMHGFAKILAQEAGPQLGDSAKEYLRRIIASAHRLDALIQDVLNYSRIARGELPLQDVPLQPFIRDILLSYPNFSKGKADIEIETPLPPVRANPAALTQVVSNLLGNAVKFVSPGVLPRVRVSATTIDGHVRLSFRDNGIGIDLESRERIFQMFQRLHRADLYEGTGIGLAIVRKAVERMGGSVRVESEPGKGSTFHVTLHSGTA